MKVVKFGLILFTGLVLSCSPAKEGGSIEDSQPKGPVDPPAACSDETLALCVRDQLSCQKVDGQEQCIACDVGHYASNNGHCTALSGTTWIHEFPDMTTQAGEEFTDLCRSWTLNNEEEIWVNAVQLEQNEFSHHSNWMYVPDDKFDGPDSTIWPCEERGYEQLLAALYGGVLYAQSTQAPHEVQKFLGNAAVRIPPHSRIISDVHVLNLTESANTGNVTLTLYEIEPEDVSVKLAPFHLDYEGLEIPPLSDSRFSAECDLDSAFQGTGGIPFGMKLYYLLPHTHALGTRMFLEVIGGPQDGLSLIDVPGVGGEARGRRFDAFSIEGATGFRFGCEFHNPRDEMVYWGFDDQEMCEVLGFADSKIAFEALVHNAVDDGTDGEIKKFTGLCRTTAFDWTIGEGH